VDRLTPLRLKEYEYLALRRHFDKYGEKADAPLVISLVFYNGKDKYLASTDLLDLYAPSNRKLAEKYLSKPAKLINVGEIDDAELQLHGDAHLMELVMKHVKERNLEWMHLLDMSRLSGEGRGVYVGHVFYYICGYLQQESKPAFMKVTKELDESIGEQAMTLVDSFWNEGHEKGIAQGLEQGIEKGIEQGIEKGIEQGIEKGAQSATLKLAQRLLAVTNDRELVAQTTQLPMGIIDELAIALES
jgi:predicted transposase/invertase (TIGR01784 family)